MPKFATAALVLVIVAGAAAAGASEPVAADTVVTRVADLQVNASGLDWGDEPLTPDHLRRRSGANLGEKLDRLPGVAAVRRAASAAEPVIRGLGWERVRTVVGAVPLFGACPGRMDPPVTYLTPQATEQVTVIRHGGGDYLGGPGGTGGAIVVRPDYERADRTPPGVESWWDARFDSARDGFGIGGGVTGGNGAVDYKLGANHHHDGDYAAPDGTVVPARQTSTSLGGSVAWRPGPGRRVWYAATYTREKEIDFPALPMDNIATDFWVHNAGWRATRSAGLLRRFAVTAGISRVDHFMDNSQKPNRRMMAAETTSRTRSGAVHVVFDLVPGNAWRLTSGLSLTRLTRDAIRTRLVLADSARFHDRLWPDAVQLSLGGHAALEHEITDGIALTLTGRADVVDSRARAADAADLGGLTVREHYVRFYGLDAARTDQTETLGQIRLGLGGEPRPGRTWFVRGGLSTRAGGITERYYAFGPAPGGFQVGNPTLAAEKKWEGECGVTASGSLMTISVSAFRAHVADFILPTIVDRRDVNDDGRDDTIKGFSNVDATLTGAELGWELRPAPAIAIPLTLSYVRGRNTSADRDLPEMPPLFGDAEIRWRVARPASVWLRGGCTFAADQDHVDPEFGEDRTGGYAVWHVGAQGSPGRGWRLGLVVDNLLDRQYHDHLTREAVLPVGDLTAGQEVPAPGRRVTLTARWAF